MKQLLTHLVVFVVCLPLAAQDKPKRPRINGIDHVRIYVTNIEQSRSFYGNTLRVHRADYRCEVKSHACFLINWFPMQNVELEQAPSPAPKNLLAEVALLTDNVAQMRRYLVSNGIAVGTISKKDVYGRQHFELRDPDGNSIAFVQASGAIPVDDPGPGELVGADIIHAGVVVKDRPAEDHFYKDILGFHVYWHGGMKDNETDWVDMQVPDGTDWIEYMLNVPANADHHTLGVMNHIALGIPDIHAAEKQLRANGWNGTEQPKIGRDGKWQLNLYDPDDTRVEFMEFTPKEKPCCSEFTGHHPGPKQ